MRLKSLSAALLAASMMVTPCLAQSTTALDLRVGKLEKEMKAVQRTVFPGGAPVQPEFGAPGTPATAPGSPASTPMADLSARIDALEKGLSSLTGQVEQTGFKLRQAEDTMKRLEARVAALEPAAAAPPATAALVPPVAERPAVAARPASMTRPPAPPPLKPTVTAKADPNRKAAVAAIEMPNTGDAAEDAYTYGFRLYAAKFYPEAVTKFKDFMAKYPTHKRASYAQNLLGRSYYDDAKPALASVAFYDNYQKNPKGERASESLYWLGQSLTRLKKLTDACKVYDELRDVYGTKMGADLKAKAIKGRADAKCPA